MVFFLAIWIGKRWNKLNVKDQEKKLLGISPKVMIGEIGSLEFFIDGKRRKSANQGLRGFLKMGSTTVRVQLPRLLTLCALIMTGHSDTVVWVSYAMVNHSLSLKFAIGISNSLETSLTHGLFFLLDKVHEITIICDTF